MKKFLRFLCAMLCDERGWTSEMEVTGVAIVDDAIPEFWGQGIFSDGNRESFWGALSGKEGSRMPIIDKTGPLASKGDKITFNTLGQLMGDGVEGESVLKSKEESLVIGLFTVTPDFIRHAVAVTKKATKQANFAMVKNIEKLLTDWMGRKLDNDVFASLIADNNITTLYSNEKTSEGALVAGDTLGPQEIMLMRMALQRQGAEPLKVSKINGRSQPIYGLVFGEVDEYRLKANTTFYNTIKESYQRYVGKGQHPLYESALGQYGNMILFPYSSILPIPQGTPLRPETLVYATLVTAGDTLSVGGATRTTGVTENYTLFFSDTGSLQVGNEIITYTGKELNSFTGLSRAVSSTTAIQHVPDALVTQRNVSTIIGFGAECVFRAMPQKVQPIGEKDDYGMQIGLGVEAYYGHKAKIDARRAKVQNAVLMKCYSANPGNV